MHLVTRILHCNLLRQQQHRPFTRAISRGPGFQADQAQDAGSIDDPAAVAGRVRDLSEELLNSVFAAEKDGTRVDIPKYSVKREALVWLKHIEEWDHKRKAKKEEQCPMRQEGRRVLTW